MVFFPLLFVGKLALMVWSFCQVLVAVVYAMIRLVDLDYLAPFPAELRPPVDGWFVRLVAGQTGPLLLHT